ncbi:MAG: glycosyl hydrolase [Armatimonadota bacterium]|nr:glycosyl hydrolase [Armatimonadota bacterium]
MERWPVLLSMVVSAALPAGASQPAPANAKASPAARRVLNYLTELNTRPHKRVLSGQFVGHCEAVDYGFAQTVAKTHQAAGVWPAIIGADYGWWRGKTGGRDLRATNRPLIAYWNAGGLVTVSWHAQNPWSGGDAWDIAIGRYTDLVATGTEVNRAWMAALDEVAAGLAELRDAGVVVLWRPFHEMNGGWFWWTSRLAWPSPEEFAAVWRHMFHYFVENKGLNNLLWVYGASSSGPPHFKTPDYYYPGDAFVDVVGIDFYGDTLKLDGYEKLAARGKPFGLTEFGPGNSSAEAGTFDYRRLIQDIRAKYPWVCFFQAWYGGGRRDWSLARHQHAGDLLRDPWVVTREELPPLAR